MLVDTHVFFANLPPFFLDKQQNIQINQNLIQKGRVDL
jgi:hypothetical protein